MKPILAELVSVILRHLDEHPESAPSESGLRTWLSRQGYKNRDIDAAIKLLGPRIGPRPVPRRTPGAVRQLSPYEELKLSMEARDALTRLEIYEMIEPYERELILERLGQIEGEVGMDELDYLLSWILCTTRNIESQQTIFNIFEGTRGTIH